MKLAIIIPAINSEEKLLENIKKNEFCDTFKQIDYFVIVDSIKEKIIYEKKLSKIKNLNVTTINTRFQSERYLYFLKNLEYDFYNICADDVYFTTSKNKSLINNNSSILRCFNEDKVIINHPFISNEYKKEVIDIFENYKFYKICVDTVISYCFHKSTKGILSLKCHHLNKKKYIKINKKTYLLYIKDLFTFFRFVYSRKRYFELSKKITLIIFSTFFDVLSAFKNLLKTSIFK